MKDLKKFTAQEILNLKDAKSQNEFLMSEPEFYLTSPTHITHELITAADDRTGHDPTNWVHYGSATVDVFRGALRFETDGTSSGANQGVQLDLAYIVGQDSTASIEAGNTYLLKCTLDNTAGKTTPRVNVSLGGIHEKVTAADGSPADGTINTTVQEYYAYITTTDATSDLQIYQPAADNDGSGTKIEVDEISLFLVSGGLNTKHIDVSGANNLLVYVNRRNWLFSFSTYEKDITGVRGGNTTGGAGANMVLNPDFESASTAWSAIKYEAGSSGGTKDAANTSNQIAGTKDLKVTNSADEIIGIFPTIVGINNNSLYNGETFKVTFKYKTNFDGAAQPDPLNVRVIGTGPYASTPYTTIASDYTKTTDFKELTTNGNFTADADDADLQGGDALTGWDILNANGGNTIALASGVLTYTVNDGSINTYIRTDQSDDGHILIPGVRYLIRVVVDSVSGGAYPIFERQGGQKQVHMTTAGLHEFIWQHDEETANGAVIRRATNLLGNFAISSVSIRPYDVAGRPFIHGLENGVDDATSDAMDQAGVEASLMFQADGSGFRNILFYMDNTGSEDSIFQVDDVRVQKIENHTLRWSSNDFFMPLHGTYMIPVPDLGTTIYFNIINDWPIDSTAIRISKL